MEDLVNPDPAFWSGKRVFLTGHTGFKGAWLWLWLQRLGAVPTGYALEPEPGPSLWRALGSPGAEPSIGDIRDVSTLSTRMRACAPDIVLHLAAQPLVRKSYAEPAATMTTNVIGTMNVLEAARHIDTVKAIVVITTDKVYANREWEWAYRETDALGGHDPYSASKACAELVTDAWRKSFLEGQGVNVATARAGNVIGGGDWSADRLVPDCLAALARGATISIRNPRATRPWQHVLEPLAGYLMLAEKLHADAVAGVRPSPTAQAWNFGPEPTDVQPVSWLADRMVALWGPGARWEPSVSNGPHEAGLLAVDIAKAKAQLGWRPRLPLTVALDWTVTWAKRQDAGEPAANLVLEQISAYEARSAQAMEKSS